MRDPRREGLRWLAQAQLDLGAARELESRFPSLACFHAQQSAEKALKALLFASGRRLVLGHSLAALTDEVRGANIDVKLPDSLAKLDRYYIPTRYPNGLPEGTDPGSAFDREDAVGAIALAERAVGEAQRSFGAPA